MTVEDHLKTLGISPKLYGYRALKVAVQLVLEDPAILDGRVVSALYAEVAKRLNTTGLRVERNMRYAITTAFERAPLAVLHQYFGNVASYKTDRVTVSTFVATLADVVCTTRDNQFKN